MKQAPQAATLRLLLAVFKLGAADAARLEAAVDRRRSPRRGTAVVSALPQSVHSTTGRSALLGRDAERAEAARLIVRAGIRLLTLTGPGGVGKTRLAHQLADDLGPLIQARVVFVPLETVRDPALALETAAHMIGPQPPHAPTALDALCLALGEGSILLVLDNVEQIPNLAPDLQAVLSRCRMVRLIATSRSALAIAEERELVVEPLAVDELAGT